MTSRYARRLALILAVPLALAGTFGAQAAFAASDRPPAPVVVSPTPNAIDAFGGGITAHGTGVPGEAVIVTAFATEAQYRAAVKRDQTAYNQYRAGKRLGGYGSGPGAAIVDASGNWAFDLTAATIANNSKAGVTYVTAFEFERGSSTYPYPSSGDSPAVKVYTSWLHQPAPPKFTGLAPSFVVQEQADGTLLLHGTGVPGATIVGFVDTTRADMSGDFSRFAAQKQTLGTACPTGDAFCATTRVQASGAWRFLVDAKTVASNRSGTFYVAAAQAVNNGLPNRWSSPSAVSRIAIAQGAGSAAAPSVFSSLAGFKWATFTPAHVALTAGAALVLTLLLGFPTTLVNSALEDSYDERRKRIKRYTDRLGRAMTRVRDRWKRLTARIPKFVGTVAWFLVAAIIAGFADPAFGFSLESLRVLLSLFVTFAVLNVLGAYVTWWATARTAHTLRPTFPARPSNLVILAVSVIVARLIHLEPGLVFGAVLGLDFGVKLAVQRKVRVILVGAGYSAVVGLAAWIGYSSISATTSGFGPVLVREFLSQLAVAGLASLPISLLPFKALNGETIFLWRRVAWGVSYAIGLVIFLFVLLPMPFSWAGVSEPLVAWVALFVAYSIVAVLIWLAVRYRWFAPRKHPQPK